MHAIIRRHHRSHSLSYHGGELATCEGWNNLRTPPPHTAADGIESWRDTATAAVARGGGGRSRGISRRGRGLAPRDSDLGFGSARMRSASKLNDRCSATAVDGRRWRHRRRRDDTDEGAGLTRRRSTSLGVEDRYGEWARSSVGDLLRHDSWLGTRCHTEDACAVDRGRIDPARAPAQGGRCGGDHHFTGHESSRYCGEGGKRRVAPYATDADKLEVQQQWLRTGGERGGDDGGEGSSARWDDRNEQRQTTSPVVDRRIATVGGAERRDEGIRGSVRGRGKAGAEGVGKKGGGGHGKGRRTNTETQSVSGRRGGELRGELSGLSAEFHGGGGQFSPTRRWDDRSLPTGRDRAREHAASSHLRSGSRPPTK